MSKKKKAAGPAAESAAPDSTDRVVITGPNIHAAVFTIEGTSPYVQNRFGDKAKRQMQEKMEQGSRANKGKKRDARDFEADCRDATHFSDSEDWPNGWIPADAIRAAMIGACRMTGFKMTVARSALKIKPAAWCNRDLVGLCRITKGVPEPFTTQVTNATSVCDLRCRPKWNQGWQATVCLEFDADQFSLNDVTNLLSRAGLQVGIGAGRMQSKNSTGCGWGSFKVLPQVVHVVGAAEIEAIKP